MTSQPEPIRRCANCGVQIPTTMMACPSCQRLVHSDALEKLALEARQATDSGDHTAALTAWREALALLPTDTKQYKIISEKITQLGASFPNSAIIKPAINRTGSRTAQLATGAGAIGLFFWKFKVLLAGLTKGSTFFSMLLSLGVYWTAWGWKFALGLVLSIYIHEMGHVIALRRYGFKTAAPMFIPGLGAVIRMQQPVINARENADIGLAGPIYGLGAALVSLGLWWLTAQPIFAAIAGVGAWINLFNLLPIGSLDGGRGFHAMSRGEKMACAASVGAAWYYSQDGLLMLLLIVCLARAFAPQPEPKGYRKAAVIYCFLVFTLTALTLVK